MNNKNLEGIFAEIQFRGEYLYGYVGNECYRVTNTPEQISAFIMKCGLTDAKIVSYQGVRLIETIAPFISYCVDQKYLGEKLLPVLVPMQRGEVEPLVFVEHELEIISQFNDVMFENTRFHATVTNVPLNIHILDLNERGTSNVSKVANTTWFKSLLKHLELPEEIESYLFYVYDVDGEILGFYWDSFEEDIDISYVDHGQPEVYKKYLSVVNRRKKQDNN